MMCRKHVYMSTSWKPPRRICAVAAWASFGKCFTFSACVKTSSAPAASACCHLHAVVVSKNTSCASGISTLSFTCSSCIKTTSCASGIGMHPVVISCKRCKCSSAHGIVHHVSISAMCVFLASAFALAAMSPMCIFWLMHTLRQRHRRHAAPAASPPRMRCASGMATAHALRHTVKTCLMSALSARSGFFWHRSVLPCSLGRRRPWSLARCGLSLARRQQLRQRLRLARPRLGLRPRSERRKRFGPWGGLSPGQMLNFSRPRMVAFISCASGIRAVGPTGRSR